MTLSRVGLLTARFWKLFSKKDVTIVDTERSRNVGLKILKYIHLVLLIRVFRFLLLYAFNLRDTVLRSRYRYKDPGWLIEESIAGSIKRFFFPLTVQVASAAHIPLCSIGTGCSFLRRKTAGREAEQCVISFAVHICPAHLFRCCITSVVATSLSSQRVLNVEFVNSERFFFFNLACRTFACVVGAGCSAARIVEGWAIAVKCAVS